MITVIAQQKVRDFDKWEKLFREDKIK
jgi:hypothetical protein